MSVGVMKDYKLRDLRASHTLGSDCRRTHKDLKMQNKLTACKIKKKIRFRAGAYFFTTPVLWCLPTMKHSDNGGPLCFYRPLQFTSKFESVCACGIHVR
jgi:hypothetical protein